MSEVPKPNEDLQLLTQQPDLSQITDPGLLEQSRHRLTLKKSHMEISQACSVNFSPDFTPRGSVAGIRKL